MLRFRLTLRRPFVADHFHDLPGFQEARHGHNWTSEATAELEDPCQQASFEVALDTWVSGVDYTLLNEQPWLQGRNPTAEALAEWLLEHLQHQGFRIPEVRIQEKVNYWAAIRSDA